MVELSELEALVRRCLDDFYSRRISNLSNLRLKELLKRKNPYLLRAMGLRTAGELVEHILLLHAQASDETIFRDAFVGAYRFCSKPWKKVRCQRDRYRN
ncbi:PmeII family type II restriction endonuclease [Chthonomonas calidirosea]|uniref:PmeII family type II restriction endonuclease n=1 Tax=Chthonomonas calidirosea TaxID=454171 RepID=UPI0006EC7816|nr:Type II restriction endonuclease EcoO109I [Chthonomonas calidirosea]